MKAFNLVNLRCEYLVNPLGIDECSPRLSWQMHSTRRGAKQQAYRLGVASSKENLKRQNFDLWDSGTIQSAQSTQVVYRGKPLNARAECFWRVVVTDEQGQVHPSPIAYWTMGLLEKHHWSAHWIAASNQVYSQNTQTLKPSLTQSGSVIYFRKAFQLSCEVVRATLYVSARGVFEMSLNGHRVGDDIFAPEWTDYHQRIHYRSYDITHLCRKQNCLGAKLGDGWWSGFVGWQESRGRYGSLENSLLVQCEIELSNGKQLKICSDNSWRCNSGPVLYSDFMMGELYDARRRQTHWDQANYSGASAWPPANIVAPPEAALVAQMSEPVRIMQELAPVKVHATEAQRYIFDFGQNLTGWCRIELPALPCGTTLCLRHGERLDKNGALYTENLRRAKACDTYICQGDCVEHYQPLFTFHGFQFLELSGLPSDIDIANITVSACVIHSALGDPGHFSCAHPGVNRLWLNTVWSQKGNFLSVPTDCPQRDERLGWTGDAQVFMRTASYHFNVAAFFSKWMQDIVDAQTEEGIFPDTAPRLDETLRFTGLAGLGGAAAWADAGIIIPHTLWQIYGDTRILFKHYSAMVRWIDWIEQHNPNGLRLNQLGNNYGDWLCIPADTSFGSDSPMKNLLATAYWANSCNKLSEIASALNFSDDAQRFKTLFEKICRAFQEQWLNQQGQLSVNTQTACLLALNFDLLPINARATVVKQLVQTIRQNQGQLNTGFVGVGLLNPQLTLNGHSPLAYRLLFNSDYPSWLYPVNNGATTVWERWDGWTEEQGFFKPQMNSFNHYSLGSVGEWLYRHVAGIELAPGRVGFQHFMLRPYFDCALNEAEASYQSVYGSIKSHWYNHDGTVCWRVTIPANTSAQVVLPCANSEKILIDHQPLTDTVKPAVIEQDQAQTRFVLPAGRYKIIWPDLHFVEYEFE